MDEQCLQQPLDEVERMTHTGETGESRGICISHSYPQLCRMSSFTWQFAIFIFCQLSSYRLTAVKMKSDSLYVFTEANSDSHATSLFKLHF